MPTSPNCPNCAAPLQVREGQTVALCLYCGSSLKLEPDGIMPHAIEPRELTPDVRQHINQLLLDGRRTEAMALYMQHARVQKVVRLGEMQVRGQPVTAARLWLEVRPVGQSDFQMERNVILRREALDKLASGRWLEVRCHSHRHETIPVTPLKIVEAG